VTCEFTNLRIDELIVEFEIRKSVNS